MLSSASSTHAARPQVVATVIRGPAIGRATRAVRTQTRRKAKPMAQSRAEGPVSHAPAMMARPSENAATLTGASCRSCAHLATPRAARSVARPVAGADTAITRAHLADYFSPHDWPPGYQAYKRRA